MARPGDVMTELITKRSQDNRTAKNDMAQMKAKQIMEGLIGGNLAPTDNPQESVVSEQAPLKPRNIGELIKSGLGMPQTEERMYKSTGAKNIDTELKKAQLNYFTGNNSNEGSPARSQEEALTRIPKGDNPKDYKVSEKTVMVKGMPVSTWVAEPDAKLQEGRLKGEEETDFIKGNARDTLRTIAEIKKGIGNFGAMGGFPSTPWDYDRKNWETNVNKLLSGKVVELITKMKSASKTGATGFGQLSDREGQILREASTALNKGLSPQDAEKYLNQMIPLLQKVVGEDMGLEQTAPQNTGSRFQIQEVQ